MKHVLLLLIIGMFGVVGCGQKSESEKAESSASTVNVDPYFNFYKNLVKQKLSNYGVPKSYLNKMDLVNLNFGTVTHPAIGECKTEYDVYSNGKRKITNRTIFIDLKKWNDINDEEMKAGIIAHEYGHCAWELMHLNIKGEIMSEVVYNISEKNWRYFVKQIMNSGN